MYNMEVITRIRPLSQRQKDQIHNYQTKGNHKRHSITNKSLKVNTNTYSFYSKYYNCNINQILQVQQQSIYIKDPQYKNTENKMKQYRFRQIFLPNHTNQQIFQQYLISSIESTIDGYNCTLLTYGITGSGKTYTIFGNRKEGDHGISYLICQYLLNTKKSIQDKGGQFKLSFSFIEIYNENVRDLLSCNNKYLHLMEDAQGNTSILDVAQIELINVNQTQLLLQKACNKRSIGSTQANQSSSRSHTIIQLNLSIIEPFKSRTSKLYIIDLAGSQKLQSIHRNKKNAQGANINKSLLALGHCINILAQNSRKNTYSHIPYRDSKLTRILKDSLGGNGKTILIACISLNPFTIEETLTTLNYAFKAQGIKREIYKNKSNILSMKLLCAHCKQKIQQKYKTIQTNSDFYDTIDESKFQELFNQIYQDIIGNARQNQMIKAHTIQDDPQWNKIKQTNQNQAHILKQTMLSLLKRHKQELTLCNNITINQKRRKSPVMKTNKKQNQINSSLKKTRNKLSLVRNSHQKFKTLY